MLVNKYYLDYLYTDIIVGGIKGPIAQAAYWFNQNVIDGVVNGAGVGVGRAPASCVYDNIDQGVVDGVVNGSGARRGGAGPGPPHDPDRQGAAVRRAALRRRRRCSPRVFVYRQL